MNTFVGEINLIECDNLTVSSKAVVQVVYDQNSLKFFWGIYKIDSKLYHDKGRIFISWLMKQRH